ncbi:hypothetical protein ACFQ3Z_03940 [Streptomyces nogalater]
MCALVATTTALPPTASAATAPAHDAAARLRFGACPRSVPSPPPPDRVECGWLDVPLDWENPGGRGYASPSPGCPPRHPGERRGVLLVNPGGPGGPGCRTPSRSGRNSPGASAAPTTS